MTRKAWGLAGKSAFVIVLFYFIARSLWGEKDSLIAYFAHAGLLFYASIMVLALFLILQARIWTQMLNASERQLAVFRGILVYINAQFAKYLPGAVWNLAHRTMLASKHGASLHAQLISMFNENVLLVSVAAAYGLLLFFKLGYVEGYAILLAMASLCILYVYYEPARLMAERLLKRFVRSFAEKGLFLSKGSFFACLLYYLGSHLLMGTAFWLLLISFGVHHIDVAEATGVFALAWLLGLLSPLPGGIGLREGAMVFLLSLQLDAGLSYQIAIVSRVWTLLSELLLFGLLNAADLIGKRLKLRWPL